ncbi:MAG: Unknown protein [uncultured Sulfurovum sp.]|uniref:DUF2202 domain-containing protein n=1 Tax=uncultured Sulfurovum sp. TaxID=269237 RepID=A0A6S6SDF2_9BACT|nr:MAG: Unknown protein [uncultured Sulfurovum sp.]
MLKQTILISTLVTLASVSSSADHVQRQNHKYTNTKQYSQNSKRVNNTSSTTLTTAQKEGLIFMIEEEKVARDVYAYLYNTWNSKIFDNISQSEQKHMSAVENLLKKYNIAIPETLASEGYFENQELQNLYNTLIDKGESSPLDAFEVGVLIEEMDIKDLKELMLSNIPANVKKVYSSLLKASYSHLTAFNKQLAKK